MVHYAIDSFLGGAVGVVSVTVVREMQKFYHTLIAPGSKSA